MKAFIVSLSIVLVLAVLIIVNSIFLDLTCERLMDAVSGSSIEFGCDDVVSLWKKRKVFVSLCAPHKEIDKIEEQIYIMDEAIQIGNDFEYSKAKTLLLNYIEQIRRHERVTIDNIL